MENMILSKSGNDILEFHSNGPNNEQKLAILAPFSELSHENNV